MLEAVDERADRGAGHDADHDLVGGELAAQLAHDAAEHLRLHRQDDDLGIGQRVAVAGHRLDAVALGERVATLAARMGGDEGARR